LLPGSRFGAAEAWLETQKAADEYVGGFVHAMGLSRPHRHPKVRATGQLVVERG